MLMMECCVYNVFIMCLCVNNYNDITEINDLLLNYLYTNINNEVLNISPILLSTFE